MEANDLGRLRYENRKLREQLEEARLARKRATDLLSQARAKADEWRRRAQRAGWTPRMEALAKNGK